MLLTMHWSVWIKICTLNCTLSVYIYTYLQTACTLAMMTETGTGKISESIYLGKSSALRETL